MVRPREEGSGLEGEAAKDPVSPFWPTFLTLSKQCVTLPMKQELVDH
jgi:hypothetical protein